MCALSLDTSGMGHSDTICVGDTSQWRKEQERMMGGNKHLWKEEREGERKWGHGRKQIRFRLQVEQLPRQSMGTRDSGRKGAPLDQRGTREERARDPQENVILQLLPPSWLCRGSTKLHLLAANGSGGRVQVGGGEQAGSGLHSALHSLAVPS